MDKPGDCVSAGNLEITRDRESADHVEGEHRGVADLALSPTESRNHIHAKSDWAGPHRARPVLEGRRSSFRQANIWETIRCGVFRQANRIGRTDQLTQMSKSLRPPRSIETRPGCHRVKATACLPCRDSW